MKNFRVRPVRGPGKNCVCQNGGMGKEPYCGKPAVWCEEVEWDTGNTTGISFFYFCDEHEKNKP